MSGRVLGEFIRALRAADIPVSTAETLDAMRAAEVLGYADRGRLRAGLGAALAKTEADRRLFDICFDRYFSVQTSADPRNDGASGPSAPDNGQEEAAVGGSAMPGSAGMGGGQQAMEASVSALSQQLLAGDEAALQAAMARAAEAAGTANIRVITQKGLVGRRLYLAMGGQALDEDIQGLEQQGEVAAEKLAQRLRNGRDSLRASIREHVARQFLMYGPAEARELRQQVMREVALRDLREFRDVGDVIRKMARKLVAVHGRRQRASRRGRLDARRTIVSSIAMDAVPWRVSWRQRRRIKPKLYVICDVSNSVSAASGFLMLFLAAVAEVLPRTRTFVFASRFAEVSDRLAGTVTESVVQGILGDWAGPGTDYAGMFEDFLGQVGGELNRRSTVIFLGDARNNDMPPGQHLLAEIRRVSGAVFWLNPEAVGRWDSGDSVMSAYAPYCRHVASCSNLSQLEHFVSVLLQDMRQL